jgi:hypothetical protein
MRQSRFFWETMKVELPTPKAGCNCLHVSALVKNLSELGVWPIATAMMNASPSDICGAFLDPALFRTIPAVATTNAAPADRCPACKRGFQVEAKPKQITERSTALVQGLCLNCLKGKCLANVRQRRELGGWHFDVNARSGNLLIHQADKALDITPRADNKTRDERLDKVSQANFGDKMSNNNEKILGGRFSQVNKGDKGFTRVVDYNGDMMIQLAEAKLLVSSKVLSLASKVWKELLCHKFPEGNKNDQGEQPCSIPFPDDDTVAMTTLCLVLHHKANEIERRPSAKALVNLAVLAAKYSCAKAIAYYGCATLSELIKFVDGNKLRKLQVMLLFPAILFDDHYAFERVTKMMLNSKTPIGQDMSLTTKRYSIPREICRLLPEGLLGMFHFWLYKIESN